MRELGAVEARRMRLVSQGIAPARRAARGPVEVVRSMVAMQGQDLRQVLRAIALRARCDLATVRAAFDRGELVRTWIMRGTLFVTTPADLATLLAATGERMRKQEWRMCTDRGIDAATAERAHALLGALLEYGPLRRSALLAGWETAGIDTGGGRGYHLLALAAYDGLVRFGPLAADEQLLVGGPLQPPADPQAALAELAGRHLRARAPIAVDELAWWTGLPKVPLRATVAELDGLEQVAVAGRTMVAPADAQPDARTGVILVPGFDEWLLGYRDRDLAASERMLAAIVPGGNGVFRPVVLVDGRAVATWRVPASGGAPALEVVEQVSGSALDQIERAVAAAT